MTRRQAFRQTDISRALKAAHAVGLNIARVEIDREGKIVIVSGKVEADETSHFTTWKARRDARKTQGG